MFTKEAEKYYAEKTTLMECAESLDPAAATVICKRSSIPCLNGGGELGSEYACLSKKAKCMLVQEN